MLLKVDLEREDIPGGETTIGVLLLITNVLVPLVALGLGLASYSAPVDDNAGGTSTADETMVVEEESNPVAFEVEVRS